MDFFPIYHKLCAYVCASLSHIVTVCQLLAHANRQHNAPYFDPERPAIKLALLESVKGNVVRNSNYKTLFDEDEGSEGDSRFFGFEKKKEEVNEKDYLLFFVFLIIFYAAYIAAFPYKGLNFPPVRTIDRFRSLH
jgi:hypothetical protein